jgi:hypothetical protein
MKLLILYTIVFLCDFSASAMSDQCNEDRLADTCLFCNKKAGRQNFAYVPLLDIGYHVACNDLYHAAFKRDGVYAYKNLEMEPTVKNLLGAIQDKNFNVALSLIIQNPLCIFDSSLGILPIHYACQTSRALPIVKLLCAAGAVFDHRAFEYASVSQDPRIMWFVQDAIDKKIKDVASVEQKILAEDVQVCVPQSRPKTSVAKAKADLGAIDPRSSLARLSLFCCGRSIKK